jgi:SAM-dependent methyltransferase
MSLLTQVRRMGKTAVGTGLDLLHPRLGREIDAGVRTGRNARLKQWVIHARLERARARGDTRAVETELHRYWQGDAAADFYDRYTDRFRDWFLGPHQVVFDALSKTHAVSPFARLAEIGCGDGRVLAHLAGRLPGLSDALGLDINPGIVARNRDTFADRPLLRFADGNALDALDDIARPCTAVVTYGGVMEYIRAEDLSRLFSRLAALPGTAVALVEPVDPVHDLARDPRSHVFGQENSFSHNHRALLEAAGLEIAFGQNMDLGGVRWTLMLARSRHKGE